MQPFKIATIAGPTGSRAALVVDDRVFPIAEATGCAEGLTVAGLLSDWDQSLQRLDAISVGHRNSLALADAQVLAPLPIPTTIYCAGANYLDHAAEMAATRNMPPPPDPHTIGERPWHFIKSGHCVVPTRTTVELPPTSAFVDWEAELAVIIGRPAKNVPERDALSYVAGYTIANDLSARDLGKRDKIPDGSPFKFDWLSHKNFDGACPMGPWMVLARDIVDPQNLSIKLSVNDVRMQSSNSGQMIFTIAEQIAELSRRMTLWPGDIILTGTPAGVGHAQGSRLASGDVIRVDIGGIGDLVTYIK